MTRFRAAWATHEAVGCAVTPSTRIRREWCSTTASTNMRAPHSVTVSTKSHASRASAFERRKSAQVVAERSGAGSMPASLRISHTVEGATFTPSTSNSPCTRRYPYAGFSRTRRSTRVRMERTVGGRPGRLGLDRAACRPLARSRCQRSAVSGRTSNRIRRSVSGLKRCSSAASKARSGGVNRTFLSPVGVPVPRSGGAGPRSRCPCPDRSREEDAGSRTCSSQSGRPGARARWHVEVNDAVPGAREVGSVPP